MQCSRRVSPDVYKCGAKVADMNSLGAIDRFSTDLVALQAEVARAGSAWACPYSSSDEFEAAVIRSKRHAAAFRPFRRRDMRWAAVTTRLPAFLAFFLCSPTR